ncbi:MAG: hypothetical protein LAP85_28775 [Acidobacteriia bacterium]|nr:hypothetical protein [Terriglobia bacterium]
MFLATVSSHAQSQQKTETLIKGKKQLGFIVSLEVKFSRVDGKFANFVGATMGLVVKPDFFIGIGGYGRPTEASSNQMAYGGLVLQYTLRPHKLIHYSIGGLLGAGSAQLCSKTFFVAEPQVMVGVNVTEWFRVGFGGGYRFIGNTGWANSRLRGPSANITLDFGRR